MDIKIIEKTTQEEMDKKLEKNLKEKYIESEQWFRKPYLWYELTSYSNPYITIHSELKLLMKNKKKILKNLAGKTIIFYGLGTGDTEIYLIEELIQIQKEIEIIGVEIQEKFIKGFVQSLENLEKEDTNLKIKFRGIKGLFQNINREDLKINKEAFHIMLGNTINNFEEKEILNIFKKLMKKGDKLLIGFQTDEKIESIFKQYSENKLFNNFLKETFNIDNLRWVINKEKNQIEAWNRDILIFHSKKKSPLKMIEEVRRIELKNIFTDNDLKTSIQIFEKI